MTTQGDGSGLFNKRVWLLREPAWHTFGVVSTVECGAQEAFSAISPYSVELQALETVVSKNRIPRSAIVRSPTPDDPQERFWGIVGPEYVLIDPQKVCEIYDEAIQHSLETIGALDQGQTLFLCTELPSWDVAGDPMKNYLALTSTYNGMSAIDVFITHVRMVCTNTVRLAKSTSTESYKIVHGARAAEYLTSWMHGLYQRFEQRSQNIQESFTDFSTFLPSSQQVNDIIQNVYPLPNPPMRTAPDDIIERRMIDYEWVKKAVLASRVNVMELFEGAGMGMDIPAAKGTGWGLYNSVTEWENWKPTTNLTSRAVNTLFGDRGARIEKAYAVIDTFVH